MAEDNLNLDNFTFHTILGAIFHCYMINDGEGVEKDTGYAPEVYEKLDIKYRDQKNNFYIQKNDLSLVVKALDWMVVMKDDSTLLDISQEQGKRLLQLIERASEGGLNEITSEKWF